MVELRQIKTDNKWAGSDVVTPTAPVIDALLDWRNIAEKKKNPQWVVAIDAVLADVSKVHLMPHDVAVKFLEDMITPPRKARAKTTK